MAKITKIEAAAALAARYDASAAIERATWMPRLMTVFARATSLLDFELTVKNNKFVLYNRDTTDTYHVSFEFSDATYDDVTELEYMIKAMLAELAAKKGKDLARDIALNKLTLADKVLLGL